MYDIGQNINSLSRVRPVSVHPSGVPPVSIHPVTTTKIVSSVLDQPSPDLEHTTPKKTFWAVPDMAWSGSRGHVNKLEIWSRDQPVSRNILTTEIK